MFVGAGVKIVFKYVEKAIKPSFASTAIWWDGDTN